MNDRKKYPVGDRWGGWLNPAARLLLVALALGMPSERLMAETPVADEVNAQAEKGLEALRKDDLMGALTSLKPAAAGGHARAQFYLGQIYDRSHMFELAVENYRKAGEQGIEEAMFRLAEMYRDGVGTAKDSRQAQQWFLRAADAGFAQAGLVIAQNYEFGRLDVQVDAARALDWYRRAADDGSAEAMIRLINVYEQGQLGQGVDLSRGMKWREKLPEVIDPPPLPGARADEVEDTEVEEAEVEGTEGEGTGVESVVETPADHAGNAVSE